MLISLAPALRLELSLISVRRTFCF